MELWGRLNLVLSEFYVYLSSFPPDLPSDSTGIVSTSGGVLLREEVLSAVREVFAEFSLLQLTGGQVSLEVVDEDTGEVISYLETSQPIVRARGAVNLKQYLVGGHTLSGRLRVVSAGSPGSVAGNGWIRLVMVP
jgi:hypothetical protein